MTYFPCTIQVILGIAGTVVLLKEVSLKQSFPSVVTVVLETYTENPRTLVVKPLLIPKNNKSEKIFAHFIS